MNKLRPLYIDDGIVKKQGACPYGLRVFRKEFGRGVKVPVTLENLRRARRAGLPTGWLAGTYAAATGVITHDTFRNMECLACAMQRRIDGANDTAAQEWKEIRAIQRKAEKGGFYANAA